MSYVCDFKMLSLKLEFIGKGKKKYKQSMVQTSSQNSTPD